MKFKNKVVVITGASSGIGEASALEFAKNGANIVLVGRKKSKLIEVEKKLSKYKISTLCCECDVSQKTQVKELSKQVLDKFECDVSQKTQVKELSKQVFDKFGRIDILVNNAGFAIYGPVLDQSIEEIESQMNTNYFGMIYCTKNFLPKMLEQNLGHIVNVASVAASFGLPGIAPYCASKFAMLGFSEGLKYELKGTNVKVTVVSPIMVRTNFFDHQSFSSMPKYSPASLSAKTVAKAVLRATNSSRLEIIVPSVVRGAVWAKHTFPFIVNPIIGSAIRKRLSSKNSYSSSSGGDSALEPTSKSSSSFNSN
ncbi:MAG: SDR family oxidoreductase [Nitrosopumilales archaeon]|nr:SDR family oxidoreductase [Nitrosopumilales archaeon]